MALNGTSSGAASETVAAAQLEQQVRSRIDSMSYLPTTVAVAMKFIELGKDPETEPSAYSRVISSDSSLSTKLLSLANSSWFGVRNKVTKIQVAVNLLGLSTVRTLAVSYCLTGLHNELRLSAEESRIFWTASLCKAVAAKQFAAIHEPKLAEEAFAAGLFQDFAIPVMYATAKDAVLQLLQDPTLDNKARIQRERALFRLDHAELARSIAQKLELPEIFVDAVAFHHDYASLSEFAGKGVIADAAYLASLFPHYLDVWNRQDAEEMPKFLAEHGGAYANQPQRFMEAVQNEFNQLYSYFEQGQRPDIKLTDLLEQATREVADGTTRLVGTVQELLQQVAFAGKEVHQLLKQQDQLEKAVVLDRLTGVLNREGFTAQSNEHLLKLARYKSSYALVYLDIDQFKRLNDTIGHACGDAALRTVASSMQQGIRQQDLVARIGGDEFAILLGDCTENDAVQVVQRILADVASKTIGQSQPAPRVTLSAGMVWVGQRSEPASLDQLMAVADKLMYEAKRNGGNGLEWRAIQAQRREVA